MTYNKRFIILLLFWYILLNFLWIVVVVIYTTESNREFRVVVNKLPVYFYIIQKIIKEFLPEISVFLNSSLWSLLQTKRETDVGFENIRKEPLTKEDYYSLCKLVMGVVPSKSSELFWRIRGTGHFQSRLVYTKTKIKSSWLLLEEWRPTPVL